MTKSEYREIISELLKSELVRQLVLKVELQNQELTRLEARCDSLQDQIWDALYK